MTFVYEFISDEDLQKVDALKTRAGLQKLNVLEWAIDRELDAFLVSVRPTRGLPDGSWYAFVWHGAVFHIFIHEQRRTRMPNGRWMVSVKMQTHPPAGMEARSALVLLRKAVQLEIREKEIRTGSGQDIAEVQINTCPSWVAHDIAPHPTGTFRG